jgi:hypothetical protein
MVHCCWNDGPCLLELRCYMTGFMVQDGWNLQLLIQRGQKLSLTRLNIRLNYNRMVGADYLKSTLTENPYIILVPIGKPHNYY